MPESAIPTSTPGRGTPISPSIPPKAMTIGNVTGSSHTAGAPSWAPHRPTETIASTWSSPEIGWWSPARKPSARPSSVWAQASAGHRVAARVRPCASTSIESASEGSAGGPRILVAR